MSVPSGRRVVLVTGASSGIGRATVTALLDRGDAVALLARDEATLVASAAGRPETLVVPADLTDPDAVADAIERTVQRFGRIDAVVHAAQVMAYGRIEDVPREVFERVVDVAMHGTATLARLVLPRFRAQGHGTLVVVNSLLGEIATPQMGAYDAAKWGQLGLARVLQLEVRDAKGVDVCVVSPGAIDTPIYDQAANYAGRGGFPPPPVVSPKAVAAAALRVLDRPRRQVEVGPGNAIAKLGFRFLPFVFDRIVGPLVRLAVFRGEASDPNPGNVFEPLPELEAEHGGWTLAGTRRHRRTVQRLSPDEVRTLRAQAVTYDDVGVTRNPPADAMRVVTTIGRGRADFERAAARLTHWQVPVGAGLGVAASSDVVAEGEVVRLRFGPAPIGVPAPCRVVWTVDEPDRRGYAYGTLPGHPETGEEAFVVELEASGRVTLTIIAVARPASVLARLGGPVTGSVQRLIVRRYTRSLS